MRIVCPSCQAAYEVPASMLGGGGQRVRCARCKQEWAPETADIPQALPDPVPEPPAAPAMLAPPSRIPSIPPSPRAEPAVPLAAPPPSRNGSVAAVLAWAVSLALVGGGILAAYAWRAPIIAAWPPSARLYQLLGLA
jgi:predicted Zn finger-like uncharacterized protein